MFRTTSFLVVIFAVSVSFAQMGSSSAEMEGSSEKQWAMNTTIIEACSCPMFCQCYFNLKPAGHGGHGSHGGAEHFCRFNNAYRVNSGSYEGIKLDGVKFWLAGDLGGDFSDGKMDWTVLTFDPAVTDEQRDAVVAILGHVYPVGWNSFTIAEDAEIEWKYNEDRAVAKLDGGKAGVVILNRFPGNTDGPVVIKNLKYWGVPRNEGFVLMPNEVEAYRLGDKAFEFKGTNGFMLTIDITSEDIKS